MCRVWSGKCRVSSVECQVQSVECGVASVECRVWNAKCEVGSVKCKVSQILRRTRKITLQTRQIFTKCCTCHSKRRSHNVPRLPHRLHVVTTWRSPDTAIRKKTCNTTRLKCCASHAKWRWTRHKVPPKRRCETFVTSKSDHFCSTSHRHGHSDLIADGCERLRTVTKSGCGCESGVERPRPNPQTPKVKREAFATHSGKKSTPPSLSLSLDMYTLHDPPPIPGSAPAIARLANGKSTTGLGLLIWWTRLLLGPMEFCLQVWPWRAWRGWWHHHGVANRNNKWRQMDWWIMVNWQLAKDFLRDGLWDLFGLSIWTAVRVYSQDTAEYRATLLRNCFTNSQQINKEVPLNSLNEMFLDVFQSCGKTQKNRHSNASFQHLELGDTEAVWGFTGASWGKPPPQR